MATVTLTQGAANYHENVPSRGANSKNLEYNTVASQRMPLSTLSKPVNLASDDEQMAAVRLEESLPTGRFRADYARSARSTCVYCKKLIEAGTFRVGPLHVLPKSRQNTAPLWHHYECFGNSGQLINDVQDVDGYDELNHDAKAFIKSVVLKTSNNGTSRATTTSATRAASNKPVLLSVLNDQLHKNLVRCDKTKVMECINLGADVNCHVFSDDMTPLIYCALRGGAYKEFCEILIENKADIHSRDRVGDTPLHKACQTGDVDIVNLLLASGADVSLVNSKLQTPKDVAKDYGQRGVLKVLSGSLTPSHDDSRSMPSAKRMKTEQTEPLSSSVHQYDDSDDRTIEITPAMKNLSSSPDRDHPKSSRNKSKRGRHGDVEDDSQLTEPLSRSINNHTSTKAISGRTVASDLAETVLLPPVSSTNVSTKASNKHNSTQNDTKNDLSATEVLPSQRSKQQSVTATSTSSGIAWLDRDPRLHDLLVRSGFASDLDRIATLLQNEDVDFDALIIMTDQDLADIGLKKGAQVKLRRGIRDLQQNVQRNGPGLPPIVTRQALWNGIPPQPSSQYELVEFKYSKRPPSDNPNSESVLSTTKHHQAPTSSRDLVGGTAFISPGPVVNKLDSGKPPLSPVISAKPSHNTPSQHRLSQSFSKAGKDNNTADLPPTKKTKLFAEPNATQSASQLLHEMADDSPKERQRTKAQPIESKSNAKAHRERSLPDLFQPPPPSPVSRAGSDNAAAADKHGSTQSTQEKEEADEQAAVDRGFESPSKAPRNLERKLSMQTEMILAQSTPVSLSLWIESKFPDVNAVVKGTALVVRVMFRRYLCSITDKDAVLNIKDLDEGRQLTGVCAVRARSEQIEVVFKASSTSQWVSGHSYKVTLSTKGVHLDIENRLRDYSYTFSIEK